MNVPPASVERVQKCAVNFEIYRFLKKAANLPHPPLLFLLCHAKLPAGRGGARFRLVNRQWRHPYSACRTVGGLQSTHSRILLQFVTRR